MNLRIVFGALLVGLLIQCVGCGNAQQELWDQYDSSMEKVLKNMGNSDAALYDAEDCLSTLKKIQKENPDALHPEDDGSGESIEDYIKSVEGIIGSLESTKRSKEASDNFDRRMNNLNR
jgi:hypothetical protein